MDELDFTVTTLYSELVERLRVDSDIPSSGSVVTKEIKGHAYDYHRISYMGKPMQFYLGVSRGSIKERLQNRAKLCSMLIQGGANSPDRTMASTIELLDAIGVFRKQNGVLIGSHAFAAIGNMLGVTWTSKLTHTMDVDIGRDFHVAGSDPVQVHNKLIKAGFMEVPSLNHRHPASSFALKKPRIKIDFLTPKRGKGKEAPVKLGGMGVYADELRFLDYLIEAPEQSAVLTRYGVLVNVPQPARYAFHKLIVATRRPPTDDAKRRKDIWQAESLIEVLSDHRPDDLRVAWEALPWKKQAQKGMEMLDTSIKF
ncbi:MAG: GSU2403 family nucleotidyltransferase fold protein [Mariprofundaceae bacterium]|nr:GSU2403 family nucleotidyltransferase fold protein [Mariprofundaceae bacterium]